VTTSRLLATTISAMAIVSWAGAGSARAAPAADQAPAVSDSSAEPHSLPQDGFFSSIKQNLREGEEEVVRGHFDLGSPPNEHRYYCLVDPKTGRREPNGVVGDPVPRPDGMTGIKISAVSMYTCAKAEQKGYLVSTGYVLRLHKNSGASAPPASMSAASSPTPAPPAAPPQAAAAATAPALAAAPPTPATAPPTPATAPPAPSAAAPAPAAARSGRIDVAGIELGMSPDEVRRVLKSKGLRSYKEWTETLSYWDGAKGGMQPIPNGRFVNVIAAWTAPAAAAAGDDFDTDGESFEVMFTPVPGKEQAMAIIHSQGFSASNAIRETVLQQGLLDKYGGYVAAGDLPQSVTWRFQSDGSVQVGDACGRRATFAGLGGLGVSSVPRENLALTNTPDQLQRQVDRCGVATVTEDHFTLNGGALAAQRLVTRFTVTAYSPAIASRGARSAVRLLQAAGAGQTSAPPKDAKAPDL